MTKKQQALSARAQRLFRKHGIDWKDFSRKASEIVIFGSSTTGKNIKTDLDLLVIGAGKRVKKPDLDIVSEPLSSLTRQSWLGSELCNHIARYGIWLKGDGKWAENVYVSRAAIDFKRKLIASRAQSLTRAWMNLKESYRLKHVVKLRRDMQRLYCLLNSIAVPPSPLLDRWWRNNSESRLWVETKAVKKFLSESQINLFSAFWNANYPPIRGIRTRSQLQTA